MTLVALHSAFENDLKEPVRVYEEIATIKTFAHHGDFTTDDLCLLEGVLSRIWQAWCRFCRGAIMESCLGTTDLSGTIIPGLPGAVSEEHVSEAAIQARNHKAVTWTGRNSILRREPTWGDVDVLLDIASGLRPSNMGKIAGMCTLAGVNARVLQAARNAAAHHNQETIANLLRLSGTFSAFPIDHACQSLFWVEPTKSSYLLPAIVEELQNAAAYSIH